MAWPPPTLPINRTNATVQQDTHPADHNAANLAINDIVARIGRIAFGVVTLVNKTSDSGGNGTPEYGIPPLQVTGPPAQSPARVHIVSYSLMITQQTAITSGYIWVGLRIGATPAGGLVGLGNYHNVPSGAWPAYGLTLQGQFPATGLSAGTVYGLTSVSGAGTYTVKSGSFLQLLDTGSLS